MRKLLIAGVFTLAIFLALFAAFTVPGSTVVAQPYVVGGEIEEVGGGFGGFELAIIAAIAVLALALGLIFSARR